MRFTSFFIALSLVLPSAAWSQQAAIGNPKGSVDQLPNRGSPQPVQPNGTAKGVGGNLPQVLGMKPLTNAGGATPGVGMNTPGYGNQINGYGPSASYKGIDCSTTAYPRSPFCPPNNVQGR
jgi:hypothetical protein